MSQLLTVFLLHLYSGHPCLIVWPGLVSYNSHIILSSARHYPLRVTFIKSVKVCYWNIFPLGRFDGNIIPWFLIRKLTVAKSTVLFGRSLLTFKPSLDGRLRSLWTSCPQPSSWLGISPAVEIFIGNNLEKLIHHKICMLSKFYRRNNFKSWDTVSLA